MSLYSQITPPLVLELGSHLFETDAIKRFAGKFDPQPFHLDEEAAQNSLFGGLCASGWHSLSVWMKLNITVGRKLLESNSGYHGPKPHFGMSPGIKNVKWRRPVYAGDTVTYRTTVTGKRLLASRPGWAYIAKHTDAFNQHGDKVLEFDGGVFLKVD